MTVAIERDATVAQALQQNDSFVGRAQRAAVLAGTDHGLGHGAKADHLRDAAGSEKPDIAAESRSRALAGQQADRSVETAGAELRAEGESGPHARPQRGFELVRDELIGQLRAGQDFAAGDHARAADVVQHGNVRGAPVVRANGAQSGNRHDGVAERTDAIDQNFHLTRMLW